MNEIRYAMQGDYSLPNLTIPEQPEVTMGRYAQMRRKFLKEHHKVRYYNLLTSCTLTEHLAETEQRAADMMSWVRQMNNLKNRVQEIVLKEVVFA